MSESLAFKYFPWQYWRPSGVNAEFDPSQANTATQNARALLIGQIASSGTATPNIAVQAYSQTQVNGLCGLNPMLALKYAAYRLMDPFGEVWLGPLADASGGTAATGSISFTGSATAAGTLPLYLMGVSIPVAVNSGDTASTIAASAGVACGRSIAGSGSRRPRDFGKSDRIRRPTAGTSDNNLLAKVAHKPLGRCDSIGGLRGGCHSLRAGAIIGH